MTAFHLDKTLVFQSSLAVRHGQTKRMPAGNIGLNAIFILRVGTGIQAVEQFNYFCTGDRDGAVNPAIKNQR